MYYSEFYDCTQLLSVNPNSANRDRRGEERYCKLYERHKESTSRVVGRQILLLDKRCTVGSGSCVYGVAADSEVPRGSVV